MRELLEKVGGIMGDEDDYSDMLERFDESDYLDWDELDETGAAESYAELKPHELKENIVGYMTADYDNDNQRMLAERMYDQAVKLVEDTKGLTPRYEYDSKNNIIESEWVEE